MIELKYKVGDKVLVKDLDWYNKNKNENDEVIISALGPVFTRSHSKYAGKVMTVGIVSKLGFYVLKEDKEGNMWYDEMFDTLAEEETKPAPKFKVGDKITNGEITFTILTLSSDRYGAEDTFGECGSICFKSQDDWKIVEEETLIERVDDNGLPFNEWLSHKGAFYIPDGYELKDENGNVINTHKIVLEKKKKTYPDTYEECCKVLDWNHRDYDRVGYKSELLCKLQVLLLCRDAYWKIAGEELGLGKPWEPDWTNYNEYKFVIGVNENKIIKCYNTFAQFVLAFPTEEMRDAFYEAFQKEIEICKELL